MAGPDLNLTGNRSGESHAGARGALRVLYGFAEGHRPLFALALVMLILEAACGVFQPYPIGYLIDFLNGKKFFFNLLHLLLQLEH